MKDGFQVNCTMISGKSTENGQDVCSVGPLALVRRGSPEQYVFEEADLLKGGSDVALTLRSHKGMGIGNKHLNERDHGPWRYIESDGCFAASSIRVRYEDQNYIKLTDRDLVFDVAFWTMREGNVVNFVGGTSTTNPTKAAGGGRDWIINDDGTISAKHHTHLALGFKGCQVCFPFLLCCRASWSGRSSARVQRHIGSARGRSDMLVR